MFWISKLAVRLSAIFLTLALLITMAGYRIGAGESGERQKNQKVASAADKRNNPRWVADPKRGWIRSDEREEQQKRRAAEQERGEGSNRSKSNAMIWEY